VPLELVVPELGLRLPQVPEAVKLTESPVTEVPLGLVTVAVMVAVSVPLSTTLALLDATATVFGGVVCVMVAELLRPALASVAVMVQLPAVLEAVYVLVALPVLSVVPVVALRLPQLEPDEVNLTESPVTGPPLDVVTVAVTVEVVAPSAGMLAGLAVTAIAAGTPPPAAVWVMVTVPLPPVLASLAVMVQNPGVVEEM